MSRRATSARAAKARGRRPRKTRRGPAVVIAVAVAGLALAAVIVAVVQRESAPTTLASEARVAHVHGLGINPKDGALYAATHTGLFRIPERGKARRVADRYQDTMGFTVVGDDHFLGSGHPDINESALRKPGRPPLLGLIESRDAGESWKPLSLLGEADFHALVAAHGKVYGFDSTSGRFMVSADKRAWETRSTVPIGSFAVDPADAEHLVASGVDGLLESRDGGRRWTAAAGPRLFVVSWDERTGLWGAGEDGTVYKRRTDGAWDEKGSVEGEPQALLAAGGSLYAAAARSDGVTSISRSSDGSSWMLLYRDDAAQ